MARSGKTRRADRAEAEKYRRVGDALLESAITLRDLSGEGDRYGNAIGVLAIHAVIAWTDALAIAYGGRKSVEGDHTKAADLLAEIIGSGMDAGMLRLLRGVLAAKDRISYTGTFYDHDDADRLAKRAETFTHWARQMYEHRPAQRGR